MCETSPRYRVKQHLSMLELVGLGPDMGIALLFPADTRCDVRRLTVPLDEDHVHRAA